MKPALTKQSSTALNKDKVKDKDKDKDKDKKTKRQEDKYKHKLKYKYKLYTNKKVETKDMACTGVASMSHREHINIFRKLTKTRKVLEIIIKREKQKTWRAQGR